MSFVDGATVQASTEASVDVENPAMGKRLFSIPAGGAEDVSRAVASSRQVFEASHWSEAALSFRKNCPHRFADRIESKASSLDALDTTEMGKPVREVVCIATVAAGVVRLAMAPQACRH